MHVLFILRIKLSDNGAVGPTIRSPQVVDRLMSLSFFWGGGCPRYTYILNKYTNIHRAKEIGKLQEPPTRNIPSLNV